MQVRRFALAMSLTAAVLADALGGTSLGLAQSDLELEALNRQVISLSNAGKTAQAVAIAERYAEAIKAHHGPEHPQYATALNNLAHVLQDTGRLADAEPLIRGALAIFEKSFGLGHSTVAVCLSNLAGLLQDTNRLDEAEPLYRRAISIEEENSGPEHPTVAIRLNGLGALLRQSNRLTEAEALMRRALAIDEKNFSPDHPNIASRLNNLALLLTDGNRLTEAEPLYRRALAIEEKNSGPDHPNVAAGLNNLAGLLYTAHRYAEAEPLYRRALAISEKSFGPNDATVAIASSNLGKLLGRMNRISEAEPLIRRALAIDEKIFGPEHPTVATRLNNLAQLLQGSAGQAEPLYRRALAIYKKHLGPDHPNVATALNNLAALRAELGDWAEAARLHRLAVPIMTGARGKQGSGLDKAALIQGTWRLRAAARAVYRDGASSADARAEGFVLAQWALQTGAADALAQMGVRFAKGAGPLSVLVRERQDLIGQRQGEDKRLLAAVGRADAKATDFSRTAIAGLDGKLAAIDARLAAEFPEYAQLSIPRPLSIALVQSLLGEDEVLVAFLDVAGFGNLSEETLAWAVTKAEVRWTSIPLGTLALAERVARLRCGLDREGQWTWVTEHQRWEANAEHCRALKRDGLASNEALPFDLRAAHELYASLLAPFADLTNGKRLFIVPSGPLTSLPFTVLVTEAKPSNPGGVAPSWLVLSQSITVLPAVSSLQALRKLPPSQARSPYIAFGNPLLDGGNPNGNPAKLARAKQRCPRQIESPPLRMLEAARGIPRLSAIFRGAVDIGALQAQTPLPETADELCAVAKALGALESPGDETETVWLGARATEANLKALSRSGKLARYRVLHFATHGLLADESEAILNSAAEPALLLSPPQVGATREQLEEDDGLLLASEVAQLQLDADWIVLSACNTAAGEKGDADALAGLARAFFYAKARALLVSHWYVNSEAAVKLTTGAFAELRVNPKIGRAEALRRSMARLITVGRPDEQQPEYWAPFVLVGEDAAG